MCKGLPFYLQPDQRKFEAHLREYQDTWGEEERGEWKGGGKRREDAGYSKQGFVSLTLSPSAHPTYQKTKLYLDDSDHGLSVGNCVK